MTNAATGCTIRIVESVDLVEVGRSKSLWLPSLLRDSVEFISIQTPAFNEILVV